MDVKHRVKPFYGGMIAYVDAKHGVHCAAFYGGMMVNIDDKHGVQDGNR